MEAKVEDIKKDVRVILDHNDVTSEIDGLTDVGTLGIDTMIENQLKPAIRQVLLIAPREMMRWDDVSTDDMTIVSSGNYLSVPLPADFLRFGFGKLSTWKQGKNWYCGVSDPQYEMQWSKYAGIRATDRKPVIAIVETSSGMEIQMFPMKPLASVETLTYAKEPAVKTAYKESSGEPTEEVDYYYYDINDTLYEAVCYECAALVAETLKDTEKSNTLMLMVKNMLTSSESAVAAQVDASARSQQSE